MAEQRMTENADSIFGKTVVELRLATVEDVNACFSLQAAMPREKRKSLEQILLDEGYLTERQVQRVKAQIDNGRPVQQIPGFQLLDKLGSGAMGTVLKARQLSLDRVVAIKVLPKRLSKMPEFVERFYREGKAAAKLNHPNIVQAIDVGTTGDWYYFVMEYVEGDTVYDALSKGKIYPEEEALDVVIQVAKALEHAHEAGLIHRDVKPKNIMITPTGLVKLADMGLAREAADMEAALTEKGRAYGTPYYIAPEQIRGLVDLDFRCDIYALGATFYHMVTGRPPFDGSSPTAVMQKHLREPLTPPDHINRDLSQGVAELIEVMMKKDRNERYDSTRDLLIDLNAVKRGEPPLQAHKKFDEGFLEGLAEGEDANAATRAENHQTIYDNPLFSWVAILGTLLGASVLINILLGIILARK